MIYISYCMCIIFPIEQSVTLSFFCIFWTFIGLTLWTTSYVSRRSWPRSIINIYIIYFLVSLCSFDEYIILCLTQNLWNNDVPTEKLSCNLTYWYSFLIFNIYILITDRRHFCWNRCYYSTVASSQQMRQPGESWTLPTYLASSSAWIAHKFLFFYHHSILFTRHWRTTSYVVRQHYIVYCITQYSCRLHLDPLSCNEARAAVL